MVLPAGAVDLSRIHKEAEMKEERMIVLEQLSQGDLTVAEAVTLLKVLSAIEALDLCCFAVAPALSIDVYLN